MPMTCRTGRAGWIIGWSVIAAVVSVSPLGFGQPGIVQISNLQDALTTVHRVPPKPVEMEPIPDGFGHLKLGPGFLVQMEVFGIPEMQVELRVSGDGAVTIPLVGAVHVAGDTLIEAQDKIANQLSDREILKNPQVTLNLVQFAAQSVSVLGEVQGPGRYPLLVPKTLSEVLAMAGGETAAAGNEIEVEDPSATGQAAVRTVRWNRDARVKLQNIFVSPGGSVRVLRAGVIYVLGAVSRPGGYLMVDAGALNVVQALSLAGGETLQASTRWAVIVRRCGSDIEQIKVPLRKMEKGETAAISLQAGDALYVPVSSWKSLVMNGSNILSAAASASIYAAANNP